MISEKPMIALSGRAQFMGHVGKEFAFGEVGCLCLQHRFMRNRGGLFGLLLRLQKGEAGIPVFRPSFPAENSSSRAASLRLPGRALTLPQILSWHAELSRASLTSRLIGARRRLVEPLTRISHRRF